MVVLGAGASHDSSPSDPPRAGRVLQPDRPPLAAELFADRPEFSNVMLRFPACQAIIPYLRRPLAGTVEEVLENLQSEAKDYPERHRQLAAIRYYLQAMLSECEDRWKTTTNGITNQKTLLDQIARWRKPSEEVCLVTFNYDRMLEDALWGIGLKIRSIGDYVGDPIYKLFKLHGSVNWGRLLDTPTGPDFDASNSVDTLIDRAADLKITDEFRLVSTHPVQSDGSDVLVPAIAIPVQSKTHFECPAEHLHVLRELIPKTTKLLMIGWRASENHFLKLLAPGGGFTRTMPVLSVAGGETEAEQSVANLTNAHISATRIRFDGGFTDFIVSRAGDDFLSK